MDADAALAFADALIFARTGEHLNDLQQAILRDVWHGRKYLEIAEHYGCTEGHAKDVGSQLWKQLSDGLGERVSKSNFRATVERQLQAELNVPVAAIASSLEPHVTSNNPNFVGRKDAIAHLNTLINRGAKAIVIQGEGGLGKTTLAQHYLKTQAFEVVLELLMAKESQNIVSVEQVVEEWLKQDFNEEPGREFGVTLGRLKRQLHRRRVGILIDNLEPALDKQGKLIDPHRNYVELFRILADARVQSITLMTSRDRLCESSVNVEHYRLPRLDRQAWQQFFSSRTLQPDATMLAAMHRAYGGNAKAMGILCGLIREDFAGDPAAYWQENSNDLFATTDLKNLVASQFDRLQRLDTEAYLLLCRLGCHRYQDVPAVPTQGLLCLLWDVEVPHRRQAIQSLRNRSLLECHKGEYWLHPVLREEAVARLRNSEDWEAAHRNAAEFWTKSITKIETTWDAIQALEAYYHYVEINAFEEAGAVILNSRDNQWKQFLTLGSTLYRMGLLQPPMTAVNQIIDRVQSDRNLAELNNILGDLYWITGKIQSAIECQEKTIEIATKKLRSLQQNPDKKHSFYYFRMLKLDSLLSIGLYKIDLWELEAAATLFQEIIALAKNTEHYRWAEKASVCLALAHSHLGFEAEAYAAADHVYQSILTEKLFEHTGRFAYFIQILGQVYKNLGEPEKAFNMYCRAISFAEASHYLQVKAKALNGLAELYRDQTNFQHALSHHLDAIELLDRIGARCDLAEAYFQLSLTHDSMGEIALSQEYLEQAMQLFADIEAPKQVEKVRQHAIVRHSVVP